MSDYSLNAPVLHSHSSLRGLFRGLFAAKSRSALPQELEKLPDHLLDDLGIEATGAPRPAETAAERLGLLDLGWQAPRPHRR